MSISSDTDKEMPVNKNSIQNTISDVILPLDSRVLYLCCMQCTDMIVICHKYNDMLSSSDELNSESKYNLALTKCRTCRSNIIDNFSSLHIDSRRSEDEYLCLDQLKISCKFFEDSIFYRIAARISGTVPTILNNDNSIKYFPIDTIIKCCNKQSECNSIDVKRRIECKHLKAGFL